MGRTPRFISETRSVYYVHTTAKLSHSSVWSFISFFFADDSKLHGSAAPSDFDVLASSLRDGIGDVSKWMRENKLKMNEDKTELFITGTKSKISQVTPASMSISNCNAPFSQSARNLGFYLDETLSMEAHVKQLCHSLFYHLWRIAKIRPFLSTVASN